MIPGTGMNFSRLST